RTLRAFLFGHILEAEKQRSREAEKQFKPKPHSTCLGGNHHQSGKKNAYSQRVGVNTINVFRQ
ncbi:hypothetical protein, partial [Vibrio parahaemolyticus]|uniref:hypothetical protein n=1 Tax=Vibrio parahaemolyticus TaxID=670 RepID=UPI001E5B0E22